MTVSPIHHDLLPVPRRSPREKAVYSECTKRSQIATQRAPRVMPSRPCLRASRPTNRGRCVVKHAAGSRMIDVETTSTSTTTWDSHLFAGHMNPVPSRRWRERGAPVPVRHAVRAEREKVCSTGPPLRAAGVAADELGATRGHARRHPAIIDRSGIPAHTVRFGAKGCMTWSPTPVPLPRLQEYPTSTWRSHNGSTSMNRGVSLPPGLDQQWLISVMHDDADACATRRSSAGFVQAGGVIIQVVPIPGSHHGSATML